MLELSDIQSSQQELDSYYEQLRAQHVTPVWIGGDISVEKRLQRQGRILPRGSVGDFSHDTGAWQ